MRRAIFEATFIMKHLVTFLHGSAARSPSAEFRIGVRSVPYLADHGFSGHGCAARGRSTSKMALCVEREVSKAHSEPRAERNLPQSHYSFGQKILSSRSK